MNLENLQERRHYEQHAATAAAAEAATHVASSYTHESSLTCGPGKPAGEVSDHASSINISSTAEQSQLTWVRRAAVASPVVLVAAVDDAKWLSRRRDIFVSSARNGAGLGGGRALCATRGRPEVLGRLLQVVVT